MLAVYRTFSIRHLRLRWPRASLVVASIALGVATWVATGILNNSLEKSIQVAVAPLAGQSDLLVSHGDYGVPDSLAQRVREVEGVKALKRLIVDYVQVEIAGDRRRQVMLLGLDLMASGEGGASDWGVTVGDDARKRFAILMIAGPQPVLVGRELEHDLPDGSDNLTVWANGRAIRVGRAGPIDASGPAATLGGNVLVTDVAIAAGLLGKADKVTRLDVTVEPGHKREEVRERIRRALSEEGTGVAAEVLLPQDNELRVRDVLLGIKIGFYLCGAGALVVGMFLVYNALSVNVAERTHDIGILRALGATRGQVAALFLGEAALLGLAGALVGLPLGLGLGKLALGPMQQILSDVFLPLPAREMEIGTENLVTSSVAGIVTALIAAVIPAFLAAAQAPAESVRRVPPRWNWRFRLVHAGASGLLIALGTGGAAFREYLPYRWGVYGGVALIFIGCLLASPLLAAACARFLRPVARRLFGIEGRLAADNLVRAPGRTGLVIAALAASVALLVQTAGVIRSNEDSILLWLDRSVTADLIISSGGPISAGGQAIPMSDEVAAQVEREFPGAAAMPVCLRPLDWERDGRPTRIILLGLDAGLYHDINRARNKPAPNLYLFHELASEEGTVVVSENFAELYHIRAGDVIDVPGADGPVHLRVLGAFEDYTWNRGTIFVHRPFFRDALDLRLVDAFDLYLPLGTDANAARERIQKSEWGARQALFALTRDEFRGEIVRLVRQVYGMAYAQLGMVALVAALGVLTALLISVIQRTRELGLLRAVGASRFQVLRTVLAEAVLMGAIGTFIGAIMGVAIQWYVVQVILLEEAGFAFPVVLPWKEAGVIAVLALVVAALAGLLPAIHAGRLRIAEAIAYE